MEQDETNRDEPVTNRGEKYDPPVLRELGSLADLTHGGCAGADGFVGGTGGASC